jgi:hypothetical protein
MSDTHDTDDRTDSTREARAHAGRATFFRRHLLLIAFAIVFAFLALHVTALHEISEATDWGDDGHGPAVAAINVLMVLSFTLFAEWLRRWFARLGSELTGVSLSVWMFWMSACYFYDVSYGHGGPAAVLSLMFCGVYAGDAGPALGHSSAGTEPARSVAVRGTRRRARGRSPTAVG